MTPRKLVRTIDDYEFPKGSLRLWLSLPHRDLWGNNVCHWRTRASRRKRLREETCFTVKSITRSTPSGFGWTFAVQRCTFHFKTKRRRDGDNLAFSMKSVWDGMEDAGVVVNDECLRDLPVRITYGAEKEGVMVEIWGDKE